MTSVSMRQRIRKTTETGFQGGKVLQNLHLILKKIHLVSRDTEQVTQLQSHYVGCYLVANFHICIACSTLLSVTVHVRVYIFMTTKSEAMGHDALIH